MIFYFIVVPYLVIAFIMFRFAHKEMVDSFPEVYEKNKLSYLVSNIFCSLLWPLIILVIPLAMLVIIKTRSDNVGRKDA